MLEQVCCYRLPGTGPAQRWLHWQQGMKLHRQKNALCPMNAAKSACICCGFTQPGTLKISEMSVCGGIHVYRWKSLPYVIKRYDRDLGGKKCKRKSNGVTTSQGKGKTVSALSSWEKKSLANWALHHAIYFPFFPEGCYKCSSCSCVTHRHTNRWSCSHWQEKCFVSLPRAVKAVQALGRDHALFALAL